MQLRKPFTVFCLMLFATVQAQHSPHHHPHDHENHHNQSHQDRQVNKLGSEIFADAPWRMKKNDGNGVPNSIPIHVFAHDAHKFGENIKLIDIDIKIKNATDTLFQPPLTFHDIPDSIFNNYITSSSIEDTALNMEDFFQGIPIKDSLSTVNFAEKNCLWPFTCSYADIRGEFWYFTFNIPGEKLMEFENVIDVEVYFNLRNETNKYTRLRIFRSENGIPSLPGWYRGDTHLHSVYTQNSAEIGLPLSATKEAAKLIGLDWITTTDHTSDFDNYGTDIASNWARIENEVIQLNNADSSMIFIKGQEVHLNNSAEKIVHMLAYPSEESPTSFPYLGDGGGDISGTIKTIVDVLDTLSRIDGFGYAAHPFAEGDKLPTVPVNGGVWNLSHSGFPNNGDSVAGFQVLCNDVNLVSDVLSMAPFELVKGALKGGQVWNIRNTLFTTGSQNDPWNVTYDNSAADFDTVSTNTKEHHLNRLAQGQKVINFINRQGLYYKSMYPTLKNWKFYYSAGSDAHGSFNYSNTDDFLQMGEIQNSAVGKLNTIAYCPNGMGSQGENVLKALKNGNTVISDGPIATIKIITDFNTEAQIGDDVIIPDNSYTNSQLQIETGITSEFGTIEKLNLIAGNAGNEFVFEVLSAENQQNFNQTYSLAAILDSIFGTEPVTKDEYIYVRAELFTSKNYNFNALYKLNNENFQCFTNPIWLKVETATSIDKQQSLSYRVFPNPASDLINIEIDNKLKTAVNIYLYDNIGRKIHQKEINEEKEQFSYQLHVKNLRLSPGVYLLKVQSDKQDYFQKLVIL